MLSIYNSLSKKIELFTHSKERTVRLYVCGITPYATTHLGHAATYVFFDVLVRYLRYKNLKVNYVQNVTDIDDDILRESKKAGQDWKSFGQNWTNRYLSDMKALNVLPPTHFIKATDSITTMIRIIRVLLGRGVAYEKSGNVYFEVDKFPAFGKLSRLTKIQMMPILDERGGNTKDPLKKNPLDFILWQKSKEDEPWWNSPWSKGRPGWHIECSAMIKQYLGTQIDIHGGGGDLIFPHHESEIGQSEAYTGKKPFSRFFLHTAMVRYGGEKMSKSLGNLVMVSELFKKYSPNAIRFLILSHHYRNPWEFDYDELNKAEKTIGLIIKKVKQSGADLYFDRVMDDDINTPKILYYIGEQRQSVKSILQALGFII